MHGNAYEEFKAELWEKRIDYTAGVPICVICGESLSFGDCDPHHAIVRQGVVQGWKKPLRSLINHPCNVVLVHHARCHDMAHGDPETCKQWLIDQYGEDVIDEWVQSLPFRVPFHWRVA